MGGGNTVWFSYTFHTYNFLISILHTVFTLAWLGFTMTTDEGREEKETRKIVKYYFILFPGLKDVKDDEEEYDRLMLVYKGHIVVVVVIKIHLTRQ